MANRDVPLNMIGPLMAFRVLAGFGCLRGYPDSPRTLAPHPHETREDLVSIFFQLLKNFVQESERFSGASVI